MHRQCYRIFKFSTRPSVRLLELSNNHINPRECNRNHTGRPWLVQGPPFSNLLRPSISILNTNCDIKYFSQQNFKAKSISDEKSDKSSSSTSSPMSDVTQSDTPVDDDCTPGNHTNQSDLFENINYDEITEGDEEKLNEFKLLMLEVDVLRQDGMDVPSTLSTEEWKELFALQSRNQRRKYLTFLFKNEMKKLADVRKKELKRLARLEQKSEENPNVDSDHLVYGFRGSTIFLRIYDTTINFFDNNRLIQAMRFGQDLVIDCGFYNEMNTMENKLCCKQLVYVFAENRLSKDPFNIHFCNLNKNSIIYKWLKKSIPTIDDPGFPINIYDEHYLDLFPKQKLVYLTPHCRNELVEFNHDDIYIVGAIVDKVNTQPLTLAKAKSEGLRMAQLPLDRYLDWAMGNKSLTVNQVVKILHDAHFTGDWATALKHVPQRKIRHPDDYVKDPRRPWKRGTTFQPPPRPVKYY